MVRWRTPRSPTWPKAIAVAAYLGLLYVVSSRAADQPWAVAALVGPLWLGCLLGLLRRSAEPLRPRVQLGLQWLLLLASALGIAFVVASGGIGNVQRLYVVEYIAFHGVLCAAFASTLEGRRPSLIEELAARVHGSLTPDMAAYARRVTIAWAAFFAFMAALSLVIYLSADWRSWALYANVATPAAAVLLFVGEHALRYRWHPEFERASLMDAVRAWRRPPAGKVA